MGFWHTGYMEFHEPTGLDKTYDPEPPVFGCQHCSATYLSSEDLRTHRFERHPYFRPVLFIRGFEVGSTTLRITRRLEPHDVVSTKCTSVLMNGEPVSAKDFPKELARNRNDTVKVELANEGVSAMFTIRFEIASDSDLAGVDRCLLDVARLRRLDVRVLEDFIAAAGIYPTAIGYCDGICEYFYGVLAKERAPDSSLPYAAYRERFSRATDILKDFDRPVAMSIAALVAFHFNHFAEAAERAGSPRVCLAARRFQCWLANDPGSAKRMVSDTFDDALEKLLTDYETERLISWFVSRPGPLRPHLRDIESHILRDIPEFDRAKLHVFLAEQYAESGDLAAARRHARELINNPTLGAWADRLINRLS